MSIYLKHTPILLCLMVLASAIFLARPSLAAVSSWQKSASFTPAYPDDFSSTNFQQSLKNYQSIGGNYVTLIITLLQDNEGSTTIYTGNNTPSDQSLANATKYAQSLGLNVAYKIHIDLVNNHWRANINPSDRATWFSNYNNWLSHYATLAAANGVNELFIGAELYDMTSTKVNSGNTGYWNNMIAGVRKIFSGKLSYSAQRGDGPYYNEWGEIGFWNNLDYLGISAYYPLATNLSNPTVNDYMDSWKSIDSTWFAPMYQQYQKPILFSELGYRSETGTHYHPFDGNTNGAPNMQEQADLYQAMLQYWNNQNYVQGLHLWDWQTDPNAGGPNDNRYTPQNKPAQSVIASWFQGGSTPNPTTTPAPTAAPAPTSAPGQFTLSAAINPANPTLNQPLTVTSSVANSGTVNDAIVDIEIYNSQNQQVFQKYFEHQNLSSTAISYPLSWQTGQTGAYRVAIGIFNNNWSVNYLWNNQLTTFTVGAVATPPSPTPTPTTTPTLPTPTSAPPAPVSGSLNIWWPTSGATLSGVQPFKAILTNNDINNYHLYWQVDGGGLNEMNNSTQDYPHKETSVDVSSWNWRGNGPYTINFIAKDNSGNILQQLSVSINVSH